MESTESYTKLFENKEFFNAIMEEMARLAYRDLRQ
jgi:hypothetical protein